MISKSLSTSRKYAALYVEAGDLAEFCQTLFPLMVAHSDDFGRLPGDVFTVKHLVLPTSPRTLEQFNAALCALDHVGLIQRYRVASNGGGDGSDYIQIIGFEPHQVGLSRRSKSKFPKPPEPCKRQELLAGSAPMQELLAGSAPMQELLAGSAPMQELHSQLKGTEQNLTELNRTELNRTELNRKSDGAQQNAPAATVFPVQPIFGTKNPHRNHAFCGKVCYPSSLASEHQQRMSHLPDAFAYVREFFRTWDDRYTSGDRTAVVIGEDAFDFWRARWLETHPAEPKQKSPPGETAEQILARRKALGI